MNSMITQTESRGKRLRRLHMKKLKLRYKSRRSAPARHLLPRSVNGMKSLSLQLRPSLRSSWSAWTPWARTASSPRKKRSSLLKQFISSRNTGRILSTRSSSLTETPSLRRSLRTKKNSLRRLPLDSGRMKTTWWRTLSTHHPQRRARRNHRKMKRNLSL